MFIRRSLHLAFAMNAKISLIELFPRSFDRWRTLPIFGDQLDDLIHWLHDRRYSSASVRNYLNALPKVVRWLQCEGVKSLAQLSEQELRLAYDYYRSREPNVGSAVHILSRFFSERGIIAEGEPPPPSPTELEVGSLCRVPTWCPRFGNGYGRRAHEPTQMLFAIPWI